MPIRLYMDHHIPRAIATGLRLHQIDVLTAAEDGTAHMADPALLDRASALGRALVTFDEDLLAEAARRQTMAVTFSGVIFAHQRSRSITSCIHDLMLIALAGNEEDVRDQVLYLPL
ncbi:MAG: DUF5615 family PIN-like protein [Chloroflexi bacterium]|nr:DUF5615 family PIN-like protein [Chloroflexota bacterium]